MINIHTNAEADSPVQFRENLSRGSASLFWHHQSEEKEEKEGTEDEKQDAHYIVTWCSTAQQEKAKRTTPVEKLLRWIVHTLIEQCCCCCCFLLLFPLMHIITAEMLRNTFRPWLTICIYCLLCISDISSHTTTNVHVPAALLMEDLVVIYRHQLRTVCMTGINKFLPFFTTRFCP